PRSEQLYNHRPGFGFDGAASRAVVLGQRQVNAVVPFRNLGGEADVVGATGASLDAITALPVITSRCGEVASTVLHAGEVESKGRLSCEAIHPEVPDAQMALRRADGEPTVRVRLRVLVFDQPLLGGVVLDVAVDGHQANQLRLIRLQQLLR